MKRILITGAGRGIGRATALAYGGLDGVVINAGIVAPSMALADMTSDRLRRVFEVNVFGAYLCARESARRLGKDRGGAGGAIVLVSSTASRLGSPFEYVDYAGSKAALDTLTIGLAKELGPHGVRVNADKSAAAPRAPQQLGRISIDGGFFMFQAQPRHNAAR